MQYFIDHIAAFIVGAVILFAVFAMTMTSRDGAVEAAQVDMGKTELRLLIDALEQDFNNMGSGMPNPNANGANAVVTAYSVSGSTTTLTFQQLLDDTATPPAPQPVTYTWRPQGTLTFPDGTTAPAIVVRRATPTDTTTFGAATDFDLSLLKDSRVLGIVSVPPGSIADSLALVRYVDVSVGLVAPAGTENLIQRTRWSKRFRPINLDSGRRRLIAARPPGVP